MIVTVLNPHADYDAPPSYDGEPAAAHLILAPGTYRCEYADEDDNPLWGTLVVNEDESHMVTGGPSKPLGDLHVGDRITFENDSRPWHEFATVDIEFAEGTIESYHARPSYAPDADPEVNDYIDLTIRTDDGVLHKRCGWGAEDLVDVPGEVSPAVVADAPTADATTTVVAEDAPIGVLLWPVRSPEYAPNYTLMRVDTVRTADRHFVRWIYESGQERTFDAGEQVVVKFS